MSSRSSKRRRYSSIKNMLVNDLNNLTITSADLNEEIRVANEDFGLFFKSMFDRQSLLFARTIGLEEKYGNIIEVLEGNGHGTVGESSHQSVLVNTAYSENERKFVEDTKTSIHGHVNQLQERLDEMLTAFQTFGVEWTEKLNDWKAKSVELEDQRLKMGGQIEDFIRNI